MHAEWQHLASAASLVAAIDLDGTLIPFAPTPQEARLDDETVDLIESLSSLPGVTLGIISGRPRELVESLAQRFPRVAFAAEHGVWRYASGVWESALDPVPQLEEIERTLMGLAKRYPGALVERKTCSVCLHWRRVEQPLHDRVAAAAEVIVDEWLETQPSLERLPSTEALEVRHRAAHKGSALAWLRSHGPAGSPVLAIGDDITDEDMFVSLRDSDVGILVASAPRRTQAGLRLPSIAAVHRFLRWLVDARQSRPGQAPEELVVARPPKPASPPQLIVASNRLPAAPSGDRQREVGGLVSALLPALEKTQGVWLGWSGAERDPGLSLRVEPNEAFVRAQFDYPLTWRQRFYAGFCNRSLWPLLHGFLRVHYSDDEWACYVDANRAYAKMLMELSHGSTEIWVQDFHLMLVARELRHAGHRGRIGFYLHVPFPALDVFETLPWAGQILAGLLDYDRIGFQTQRWADNFVASARGLLGSEAEARARDRARVVPVGIDPDRFAEAATVGGNPNESMSLGLEAMLGGRKLILGVDRLDYSKGIPERLEAFARLLENFPEWRNQVSFVQVSVPTRSDVPEYGELRGRVESLVGRINGAYGEADWVPVRYLYRSYDQETLARLYRQATVGLVTPLRDGMNLVAKEFVAAQDPEDPGVLLLSKFAGAAEHLTLALLTNPYHPDGLAADLDTALRMPREERMTRNSALRAIVWRDTAAAWAQRFLDELRG
ncbi:MAG TPA: trehalose-phosphatase [Kofleriaceae bacterium]|nr:trehalose-phosphatase [Kofleriaceae bacterium]